MTPPASATAAAGSPLEPFPHLSLVSSSGAPRREDIDGLATALLDLGAAYENALRAVMCVQRLLERIRCGAAPVPESALLIQEMARHLAGLSDGADTIAGRLEAAARRLRAIHPQE